MVSSIGIVSCLAIYSIKIHNIRILTISAILLLSLVISNFLPKNFKGIGKETNVLTPTQSKLLNLFIHFLFVCSILILYNSIYYRPASYFLVLSIITLLIFFEFLYSNSSILPLFNSILLLLNLWIGLWAIFPSLLGGDSPFHFGLIKIGLENGNFLSANPAEFEYVDSPIFHIACIIHILLLKVGYKISLITSLILPLAILLPVTLYCVGNRLLVRKLAAISLLVGIYPFFAWYIYNLAPFSYGIMIFLSLFLILLHWEGPHIILGIIVLTSLGFTHPLIMSIIMIFLLLLLISYWITCLICSVRPYRPPFALAVTIFVGVWMYHSYVNWVQQASLKGLELLSGLSSMASPRENLPSISGNIITLRDLIGDSLFSLSIAFIISLWAIGIMMNIKEYRFIQENADELKLYIWFMIGSVPFILFIYFINLIGTSSVLSVISYRWLGIAALLSAPVLMIVLSSDFHSIKTKYLKVFFVFLVILLMITNPLSDMDNPFYGEKSSVRWAYTSSEICGMNNLYVHNNISNIIYDNSLTAYFRILPFIFSNPENTRNDKVVAIRGYIFDRSFYIPRKGFADIGSMDEADKKIIENDEDRLNLIYNNADFKGLLLNDKHPLWIKKYFALSNPYRAS